MNGIILDNNMKEMWNNVLTPRIWKRLESHASSFLFPHANIPMPILIHIDINIIFTFIFVFWTINE